MSIWADSRNDRVLDISHDGSSSARLQPLESKTPRIDLLSRCVSLARFGPLFAARQQCVEVIGGTIG